MSEQRKCKQCGEVLKRKRYGRRLEGLKDFNGRNFCNISCSAKYRESQKVGGKSEKAIQIEQAIESVETGTESEILTGVQILRIMANDRTLDVITRLNAAKALAPYETRKASEIPGKKETREDAAKKAASGRFSTGAAPILPFRKKDQS